MSPRKVARRWEAHVRVAKPVGVTAEMRTKAGRGAQGRGIRPFSIGRVLEWNSARKGAAGPERSETPPGIQLVLYRTKGPRGDGEYGENQPDH